MPTFHFLVTVETERESGLHASKDDQSDIILAEIESVIDSVPLSGLGARSDSEYSVVESSVEALDSAALKALNAEHEALVREELPGDQALRNEMGQKVEEIRSLLRQIEALENKVARMDASTEVKDSDIWWEERHNERHYIPSDAMVYFAAGDERETFRIKRSDWGPEVMYNGWRGLLIKPNSSNVFYLQTGDK